MHEDLLADQADILSGSLVEESTDMNALKELGTSSIMRIHSFPVHVCLVNAVVV